MLSKGRHHLSLCLAGRIRTEIVHILANNYTLERFKRQKRLAGSELVLTDFDEDMSVEDIRDFMRTAQADEAHTYVLALRAREGTTLSLLRLYGVSFALLAAHLHCLVFLQGCFAHTSSKCMPCTAQILR